MFCCQHEALGAADLAFISTSSLPLLVSTLRNWRNCSLGIYLVQATHPFNTFQYKILVTTIIDEMHLMNIYEYDLFIAWLFAEVDI
jgi:coenzyme F420-reducing hydrogenase delta subunit